MGASTFVKKPDSARQNAHQRKGLHLLLDVPLLLVTLALLTFGMLMVYSASWQYAVVNIEKPANYVLGRQVIWVLVGLLVAFFASRINYHAYQRLVLPIILVTILALVAVLVIGMGQDYSRTIVGGSIQPSEMAKLAIVMYLAVWLNSKKDQLRSMIVPLMSIVGIVGGLVFIQPDKSAALTIITLGIAMFILADGDWKQIVKGGIIALLFGTLVVLVYSYSRERVVQYWQGLLDPTAANDQAALTMEAVVRGKFFGVGIGNGTVKFKGMPVPWTDSIFAVIAEETGFFGALVVISLYVVFFLRGMSIARRAPDMLGRLLAAGITSWIGIEAIINISVVINLMPVAGNPLPLVSYGGSSMITTMAGIGILMGIARASAVGTAESNGRSFGAVIDLRRWDRRRRVSRSNHSSRTRR